MKGTTFEQMVKRIRRIRKTTWSTPIKEECDKLFSLIETACDKYVKAVYSQPPARQAAGANATPPVDPAEKAYFELSRETTGQLSAPSSAEVEAKAKAKAEKKAEKKAARAGLMAATEAAIKAEQTSRSESPATRPVSETGPNTGIIHPSAPPEAN